MFSVGVEILATPSPQLQLKPITYRLPLVLPVVGLFQHGLEHLASDHDQKKRHVCGSQVPTIVGSQAYSVAFPFDQLNEPHGPPRRTVAALADLLFVIIGN
jgi:hypothetical protein